eukprot:510999_1
MLLKVYLDDKVVELSAIQNQQIREIIQQPIPPQLIKKNVGAKSDLEDGVSFQYVYEFDVNNTLMDSWFSGTYVQKFKQFIDHKFMIMIIISFAITCFIVLWISMVIQSIFLNVSFIVFLILLALWLISKHLICNKDALKLCLQSFDYWVKFGYSLIWSIDNFVSGTVGSGLYRNRYFILVLGTSYVAVLDASPSKYTTKLIFPIMLAILFSCFSLSTFLSGEADCDGPNTISIKSLASSSDRILCIFFWKQAFKTWRHKNRASSLAKSPRIVWIDNTSRAPQVQQNENTTDTAIHSDEHRIDQIIQSNYNLKTMEEGTDDLHDDMLSDKEETEEESLSMSTPASECISDSLCMKTS